MHVCLGWNPIMHMSTYINRELFSELNGFNIAFRDSGDYEMFARALTKTPYCRLSQPLACFRQTGANNSATNTVRTRKENATIRGTFGPPSELEQNFWRAVLKVWFNGRNPSWLMTKMLERGRSRLGHNGRLHFASL
jgi:hypothetical protein